jgi:uncharacterized UBP type Zn finger protein
LKSCPHLEDIRDVTPSGNGCADCLRLGWSWAELRMCLICGNVGCCDSSRGRHATRHFHATRHPIMMSVEKGMDWRWCYVDERYV